jgi:uncharacterized protein
VKWFGILVCIFSFSIGSNVARSQEKDFATELVLAARERTKHFVIYDGAYRKIKYPMGDVPDNIGVCTDLIIRSYRKLGFDLQQLVHEDMRANFNLYPTHWGLKKPDTNIDHRRVPNLQVFFSRFGLKLPVTQKAEDYKPGDLVTWELGKFTPHIGIVSNKRTEEGRPYIIHNIGWGPKEDDMLFDYQITGHYRYHPAEDAKALNE